MHQSIDKKKNIVIYLIFLILLSTTGNKSLEFQKINAVTINKINVSGLSSNNNLQITNKLKGLLFKNILFITQGNINKIISQYNLVESYSAKKIYPKRIDIKIKQTKFIAKISGNNKFLIGSNGKLVENETTNETLPFLFGEFNSKKFLKFKRIVENSEFKFIDFKSIFFYSSNRLDILTIDDILIKLPEKNLKETLRVAHKIIKNDEFKNNRVIDLRISNHIIVQ